MKPAPVVPSTVCCTHATFVEPADQGVEVVGRDGLLPHLAAQEVVDQLERVLPTVPTVAYEHYYLRGSPVSEVLTFAADENIDLIVMASHGRTGLSRLLMGSIAEGVTTQRRVQALSTANPVACVLIGHRS
jgi:nucleotide-binding universal stress UspA family protein